ncbi:GntR family transcriptional regulator [Falsirhodobacter sp. 20TX0035]|uniref:GntR family transcriptional regulator n=1 Tax=Falsirhodobacter sp. 20TX0035 TaxID=3022019 RepID=UPI00232CAA5D|nr:GntR family transcriptional regulator [Falsirhodobacter sp. 20TX0035]MDB6452284.1 GntR family transcriptional regulator [Falsirhodobacter sp. 20TX0035]
MDLVHALLREEILDLVRAPGSPIDEIHLAQRLFMSRTPVRAAIVRLASEGLVTVLPNRSAIVSTVDLVNLRPFLEALTLMHRVTARLAAERRTEADLAAIRVCQARFTRARSVRDRAIADRELHAAIAGAGRNPYYTTLLCRLLDEERRLWCLHPSTVDPHPEGMSQHEALLAAITSRDIAQADHLAQAHTLHLRTALAQDLRRHPPF